MVTTQQVCARCSSEHIRRNGHSGGHARYQCKILAAKPGLCPLRPSAQPAMQVEKLLAERNSQRSTVRVTGVARMTVAKPAKKSATSAAALAPTTAEKSAASAVGSTRTRLEVDVCGSQAAQSLALARR